MNPIAIRPDMLASGYDGTVDHQVITMGVRALVLSLLIAIFGAASVSADYPNRPVRIIAPVAAGSSVDAISMLAGEDCEAHGD
jgi:hypothetical protein